jgi:hypothetical protein
VSDIESWTGGLTAIRHTMVVSEKVQSTKPTVIFVSICLGMII